MTEFIETDGHDVTDESHRATCAECAAVWADLERISAEARELPRLTPSRDLWSGIEARIADRAAGMVPASEVSEASTARGIAARRWTSRPIVRLATAASLLVAATATVTWTLATSGARVTPVAQVAPPVAPQVTTASQPTLSDEQLEVAFGVPTAVVARVQQASIDRTVATMDREIGDLQKLLDGRRRLLNPRTVAVLEANMQLIDEAIAESRKALAADPASRFLATQYARAYTSKLTLLRDAATLPTGD
jgi:hypothetical protein